MSTYTISDIHGCGELWDQVKKFLKPEDTLYCLGDCADRGPDGWRIIKEMLARPNTIYLMGNHEDLLLNATIYRLSFEDKALWLYNGGEPTQEAMLDDDYDDILNQLSTLPYYAIYHNTIGQDVIMTHAGCTVPNHLTYQQWLDSFSHKSPHTLMWNRSHFTEPTTNFTDKSYVILHGHTPAQYVLNKLIKYHIDYKQDNYALWYDNNTKCDIDMSSAYTGIVLLIDLDTWEEYVFKGEPVVK